MKKLTNLLFLLFVVLMIFWSMSSSASFENNVFILASIENDFNDNVVLFYPQLTFRNEKGWNDSVPNDISMGQKFEIFSVQYPNEKVGALTITANNSVFPIKLNKTIQLDQDLQTYWGYYKTKETFEFTYLDVNIPTKFVSSEVTHQIKQTDTKIDELGRIKRVYVPHYIEDPNNNMLSDSLKRIVEIDYNEISCDFSTKFSIAINEFAFGDINGDGVIDYVIIVGDPSDMWNNYDEDNSKIKKGMIATVYLSSGKDYIRANLGEWAADETPSIMFLKDFNGDGCEELFMKTMDGDSEWSLLFSWFKGKGLKKINGGIEFWYM